MKTAAELKQATGTEVSDDPYSRGYWSRRVGDDRPSEYFAGRGWDHADRELAVEAAKGMTTQNQGG